MAKLSLLDMTQNILSAMDSDPVNSIDDTVESQQIAVIIKECYYDLMARRDWAHLRHLYSLDGLADEDYPTTMTIPENAGKVLWMRYNKKLVTYMDPYRFKDMIDKRVEEEDVVDENGYILNRDPVYWTSYDDNQIVFDSIDKDADDTLHESKSTVYGVISPSWSAVDEFVPDLPEKYFPTLLAEAKAQAFVNLKQQQNVREEGKARRGVATMQNEHWRVEDGELKYNRKVNYGRR